MGGDELQHSGDGDVSAFHALACSVKADLIVWQPAVEPALLGHACVAGASPSTVMLRVALVNDLHFWGEFVYWLINKTSTKVNS